MIVYNSDVSNERGLPGPRRAEDKHLGADVLVLRVGEGVGPSVPGVVVEGAIVVSVRWYRYVDGYRGHLIS